MTNQRMTSSLLVFALLLISSRVSCDAISGQVEFQQQQQQQSQKLQPLAQGQAGPDGTGVANGEGAAGGAATGVDAGAGVGASASAVAGADGQQTGFYLASFDPAVTAIPQMQREFVNQLVANDLELFREILREAIERRNKFAPSVGLIWKYAGKLIGRFISNRREELKLAERMEPRPEFFRMVADLMDAVVQRSTEVKKEKGYTKGNVDTDELYRRADNLFRYIQSTIEASPVAAYLKWNELILFKGDATNPDHDRPIVDEAADLTAQFRGMGYESCTFVARRIVNLLRMFSKGSIPLSDKDV